MKPKIYEPNSKAHADALFTQAAQKMDELRTDKTRLRVLLMQCEDYFEPRADADIDGDGGCGNDEMKLLVEIRETLRRTA